MTYSVREHTPYLPGVAIYQDSFGPPMIQSRTNTDVRWLRRGHVCPATGVLAGKHLQVVFFHRDVNGTFKLFTGIIIITNQGLKFTQKGCKLWNLRRKCCIQLLDNMLQRFLFSTIDYG